MAKFERDEVIAWMHITRLSWPRVNSAGCLSVPAHAISGHLHPARGNRCAQNFVLPVPG